MSILRHQAERGEAALPSERAESKSKHGAVPLGTFLVLALVLGQPVASSNAIHGGGGEKKDATVTHQVTLTAKIAVARDKLEVQYTLRNTGSQDVFIPDMQKKFEGQKSVSLRPSDPALDILATGIAVVAQKLFTLDPTISWMTPPRATASLLKAGQVLTRTLSFPLPLRPTVWEPPFLAYRQGFPGGPPVSPPAPKLREVVCHRVRLIVGVIPSAPALDAREVKSIEGKTAWDLSGQAWGLQEQAIFEADLSPAARALM